MFNLRLEFRIHEELLQINKTDNPIEKFEHFTKEHIHMCNKPISALDFVSHREI